MSYVFAIENADTFTVSAKLNHADTWFLLLISAIWAELRLVGVITKMRRQSRDPALNLCC
jgi:hypothetical protein